MCALVLLVLLSSSYQAWAGARDARRFPAPGALVDVGSHRMHLYCTGQGSPTVLLDHASGSLSGQWGLIQPVLAEVSRTCSYDRSGYGWSEESPDGSDARTQAAELTALLEAAGEEGPYVHVGHSSGAFVGAIFASEHPRETAGLVMIEPGYVWGTPGMPRDLDERVRDQEPLLGTVNLWAARTGIGRLLGPVLRGSHDLPGARGEAFDALASTTRQFTTFDAEIDAGEATASAVLAARSRLQRTPLLVFSAAPDPGDRMGKEMRETHRRIAATSRSGEHVDIDGTDHMGIVLDQRPATLVAEQITGMLGRLREQGRP